MTVPSTLAALLALAVAACAEPVASRTADLAPPGRASRSRDAVPYDAPAVALGLRPLRDVTLGPGEREIRLWPYGLGIPHRLIRVADRRGVATTDVYAWWIDGPIHQNPVFADFEPRLQRESRCGPIQHKDGFGFCLLASAPPRKARAIVRQLESFGGWEAAANDPAAGETEQWIQIDGSSMTVETRRGARYDASHYWGRHLVPGSTGRRLLDLPSRF
ncbi:MAG TPA: hypothetical protein VFJ82_23215 [Longimicrobium sp.]|nr:hypothetical protein [Longimicrobium sp.]